MHRVFRFGTLLASRRLAPTNFTRKLALQRLAIVVLRIRSTTEITIPSSVCTRKRDEFITDGILIEAVGTSPTTKGGTRRRTAARGGGGGREWERKERGGYV
ncbi:hypothetical protein F511_27853 [Dorcoceras hygrometricum]|uniref:Uncharacterized protein n=1 Tax=Dorcoceras hygrometricum TaxID=472368 RepID=A0A2Z7C0Z5_9LAMI|nr:hypothetical protein F511_27853 [Dorcoceras hygrometricum]